MASIVTIFIFSVDSIARHEKYYLTEKRHPEALMLRRGENGKIERAEARN